METNASDITANIHNIMDFPTVSLEIDFERPDIAQNKMIELVETLEKNSLIGNHFGIENNIGEGYVFTFTFKNELYKFKVKGEEHSNSKVKTLNSVDSEKENIKIEIANKVTPAWRLEQMFDLANNTINGMQPSMSNIGTFIKLVNQDIIKEESDVIASAGLEPKDIFSKVAIIVKKWYIDYLDTNVGLI